MPRVSIVITARNVADQLPRCIASLSAQTFGDFEAIVVDDASKDGTSYVAQGATKRDPRFQMLQQPLICVWIEIILQHISDDKLRITPIAFFKSVPKPLVQGFDSCFIQPSCMQL